MLCFFDIKINFNIFVDKLETMISAKKAIPFFLVKPFDFTCSHTNITYGFSLTQRLSFDIDTPIEHNDLMYDLLCWATVT